MEYVCILVGTGWVGGFETCQQRNMELGNRRGSRCKDANSMTAGEVFMVRLVPYEGLPKSSTAVSRERM